MRGIVDNRRVVVEDETPAKLLLKAATVASTIRPAASAIARLEDVSADGLGNDSQGRFVEGMFFSGGRMGGGSRGKRGQSPFAGTARRVLRTNGDCPLFPTATCSSPRGRAYSLKHSMESDREEFWPGDRRQTGRFR